jgi:hypothetical protein
VAFDVSNPQIRCFRSLTCCSRPLRCKSVCGSVEAAVGELNRMLDQIQCSPSAFRVGLIASPKGFVDFWEIAASHRRVEVSGAALPRARRTSRQHDPARAGTQRPKKARGNGNDGRPSPLTVLNGYCDCAQLLGPALRHAMDDVRRKSVPDIVRNRATRRPGIS